MSSGTVSPFHSSSDCPTAHVSRVASQTTGDEVEGGSHVYSETTTRPVVSKSATANSLLSVPASDAFVSPRSGPPPRPGSSAFASPADVTPRGPNRPRRSGGSELRIALPAPPRSPSGTRDGRRSPAGASEPHAAWTAGPLVVLRSPTSAGATPTDGVPRFPTRLPGSPPSTTAAAQRAAASRERSQTVPPAFAPAVPGAAGAGPLSPQGPPPHRSASSPLVPTSRGFGSERRRTAEPSTPGLRMLPPLPPPARPPSAFFVTSASRSGSVHGGSQHASPAAAPLPLASISTTAEGDGDDGWWAAARRFVSNRGEQVNAYLEEVVNPGGAVAAEAEAQAQAVASRSSSALVVRAPRVRGRTAPTSASPTLSPGHFRGTAPLRPGRTPSLAPTPLAAAAAGQQRAGFEPYSERGTTVMELEESGPYRMPLDRIVIDPSHDPFVWHNSTTAAPVVHFAGPDMVGDSFLSAYNSGSDVDAYNAGPNTYVVDLLSALRGYRSSPTEAFGHLVAAALASRSREVPVRGFEVAAAAHHPYLVRLILDSGTLDVDDAEAQQHVQETLDGLISTENGVLSPAIYEYLNSFLRMPFVRLSHAQYTLLKRSGFEYIKLMYDHQHVLPEEHIHSILIHQSRLMHCVNIAFMLIHLCANTMCTVSFAIVLANWMRIEGGAYQNYGFYTLIVFGGGWALNLIFTMCAVRSHEDERRYEPRDVDRERLSMPSPYVAVVPVLPLFDIMCVIAYIRALQRKRMILSHNILTCSRLSGIFHAMMYAFPQLITQTYFNNIEVEIKAPLRHRWSYTMLLVTTVTQWSVALLRYAWSMFTHDSIDGFGFACFNQGKAPHPLERHNGVAHVLHYVMASVMETNVYLLSATAIQLPVETCGSYIGTVLIISSVCIAYSLILYLALISTDGMSVRISFSCAPLVFAQVALLVCSERIGVTKCAPYRNLIFHSSFIFGYLSWGAYFSVFLLWLVLLLQWCLLCTTEMNTFPRLMWPWARRDPQFVAALRPVERGSSVKEEDAGRPAQTTSSSEPTQGAAAPAA